MSEPTDVSIRVRPEESEDIDAIRRVNRDAFGSGAEADLVEALREAGAIFVSLVAEVDGEVVGHILFSPVEVEEAPPDAHLVALGPMAVRTSYQRRGVGTALADVGLDECTACGATAVIVLGHPDYYPRFGFAPAVTFGLHSEYTVQPEVFMARELTPDALADVSGLVKYHPAFANVD